MISPCILERKLPFTLMFTDTLNHPSGCISALRQSPATDYPKNKKGKVVGPLHAPLDFQISEYSQERINCSSTQSPIITFVSRAEKTKAGKTKQKCLQQNFSHFGYWCANEHQSVPLCF